MEPTWTKLKAKTRQRLKSRLNDGLENVRKKAALKEANKPPERSHGDERIQAGCRDEFDLFKE